MTSKLTIQTYPNEAAAAYIRGKAAADPKNFGQLPDQLKQRAFMVSGIERLDAVRKIRDAIAKLPEGASWDEAKREIAKEISPFVGTGDAKADMKAARARANHILRMQGFQAYAVARHQQQTSSMSSHPYWMYQTVGDARVRAGHAKLDGKVLRADDPWWKTHYPPWDWGCRCIVIALDEEDAKEIGITKHGEMPEPERSGSWSFDPSDAGISLDQLTQGRADADCRLLFDGAKNARVQRDDGTETTMWDYMLDRHMATKAGRMTAATERDGKERSLVVDWDTGKTVSKGVGDEGGVYIEYPGKPFASLHTHPNGDNTPSPRDMMTCFGHGNQVNYIAAGRRLRRWKWIKEPTENDKRLMEEYDEANRNGGLDMELYNWFLFRLANDGYIKMEVMP